MGDPSVARPAAAGITTVNRVPGVARLFVVGFAGDGCADGERVYVLVGASGELRADAHLPVPPGPPAADRPPDPRLPSSHPLVEVPPDGPRCGWAGAA